MGGVMQLPVGVANPAGLRPAAQAMTDRQASRRGAAGSESPIIDSNSDASMAASC